MGKQRLLVVIGGLPVGGAEKMLISLVNRFDRQLFDTTVVSLSEHNPLAAEIDSTEIKVIPVVRRWRYDVFSSAKRIAALMEDRAIEAVLCFELYAYIFVHRALRMLSKKRTVVISLHTTRPQNVKEFVQYMIYARLLHGDEQLVSVSNAQAYALSKMYFIPRDRFTTIYNGVDTTYFKPYESNSYCETPLDVKSCYGIPEDAFVIVQVASLSSPKRHEDVLFAMKAIRIARPDSKVFLLLVGGGTPERENYLKQLAITLGVSDRVVFCGVHSDIRPFLRASHLFTLSSRSEAFPVSILEAMAMGLPCVVTDAGGVREVVKDGFNGYIVSPSQPQQLADAWWRVLSHLNFFESVGIRQYIVDHFSIEPCVRRYEALLRTASKRFQ